MGRPCRAWIGACVVQSFAHFTWAQAGRKVKDADLRSALDLLIAANQPLYMRECGIMSRTQVNLIKAVLSGETRLTSTAVMQEFQLGTPRNVQKARMALEGNDVIGKTMNGYERLDPGFARWFGREFLGRPIRPFGGT